jgi:hypothetical protein
MRSVLKNWVLKGVIVGLLLSGFQIKAEPELPAKLPTSANWIDHIFNAGLSLGDVSNPLNWVIYSAAGTYFYYQFILKGSLKTAVVARDAMVMELRKTHLELEEKNRKIAEVDQFIEALKEQIAKSQKSYEEIPALYKELNRHRAFKSKKNFGQIGDYSKVERWLLTNEGKKFLGTEDGKSWLQRYESLKYEATTALEMPLKNVIDKANDIVAGVGAEIQGPSLPHKSPQGIRTSVESFRKKCDEVLSGLVKKKNTLRRDSNIVRFWIRKENITPALNHGMVTLGGAGVTYWLYNLYRFDDAKSQVDEESKLKGDSAFDLISTIKLPKSRELMRPYYNAIRTSLEKSKEAIITDVESPLTLDQKRKIDVKTLVEERIQGQAFYLAVELATLKIAKDRFGERISFAQLNDFIQSVRAQPEYRVRAFKQFHKELVQDCINSLWSEFSIKDATDRMSESTLKTIIEDSEQTFFNAPLKKLNMFGKE